MLWCTTICMWTDIDMYEVQGLNHTHRISCALWIRVSECMWTVRKHSRKSGHKAEMYYIQHKLSSVIMMLLFQRPYLKKPSFLPPPLPLPLNIQLQPLTRILTAELSLLNQATLRYSLSLTPTSPPLPLSPSIPPCPLPLHLFLLLPSSAYQASSMIMVYMVYLL